MPTEEEAAEAATPAAPPTEPPTEVVNADEVAVNADEVADASDVEAPDPTAEPTASPDEGDDDTATTSRRIRQVAIAAAACIALLAVVVWAGSRGGDDVMSLSIEDLRGDVAGGGPIGTSGVDTVPSIELPAVPEETPTTPTTRKPRRAPTGPAGPLTGAATDYPGYQNRPALIVKIDNDDLGARPQAGLTLADIVYEEKVEGGITRFAAVFQGSDSDPVGPIRSARSTDIHIVGSYNRPLYAYSGANAGFEELVRQAPLVNVGAGTMGGSYFRGYGVAPHNLYANTSSLFRRGSNGPPPPQFGFRSEKDRLPPNSRKTAGAQMQFGGSVTRVVWRWEAGDKAFQREQNGRIHYDVDNWPVQAANVIVQFVEYVDTGYVDTAGAPVPEAKLEGTGSGWVLTGGYAVPITWEKPTPEAPTIFWDANHNVVNMLPGKTWIELVPRENNVALQW